MKKIFAFAVAAALCGISVSCGSDDDDPNGPDGGNGGPSAGRWYPLSLLPISAAYA